MQTLTLSSFALALATTLPAQCLFTSVTPTPFGQSCNVASTGFCAVAAFPSFLLTELDVANCSLEVDVTAFSGCGATVPLRFLAIGFQSTFVPLPMFGLDCALQVDPIAILTTTGTSMTVALPPGVQTFQFVAQGVAWSNFPWSPSPDVLAFTAPYAISLQ
ncbi:MAG: hypothetical protein JNL08_08255 [Planctomycetes bacterium]|nr:hypothetical protein [Planctomycetota bacterium]